MFERISSRKLVGNVFDYRGKPVLIQENISGNAIKALDTHGGTVHVMSDDLQEITPEQFTSWKYWN